MNVNDYENHQLEEEHQPKEEPEPTSEPLSERIHDDSNGLDYVLVGGWHYLPDFGQSDDDNDCQLGTWARWCLRFIKNHRRALYSELLTSGKLAEHLCEIDRSAEAMYERLVAQMSEQEGLTEELKATNQMAWVQLANSIRNHATETVTHELINV
jgi:hypothetical protein